jgi:predicted ArsR family transcriptional regulator
MQQTRQFILDILREQGEATVDEVVDGLYARRGREITPVTVRHHLNLLQQDGLVTTPELRRRSAPGRPQHVYALTAHARDYFPNNYERLAAGLIARLERELAAPAVNVIFEGVAEDMARDAAVPVDAPAEVRITAAVTYLNERGYSAHWDHAPGGLILHTRNCPYHQIAKETNALCQMDMRLVAALMGSAPRLLARMSEGDSTCSYLFAVQSENNVHGHR